MSTSATKAANTDTRTLREADVVEFLKQHPEVFDRNPRLLQSLTLPHESGGTVSLVERQVASLRASELATKRKLNELVGLARRNDALASRIHALALALLEADSLEDTLKTIEEKLRRSFSADEAVMVLFVDGDALGEIKRMRFLRSMRRDDTRMAPFKTFLDRGIPRCGQIRDTQRDILFGKDNEEIGSVALLPLAHDQELGFLAIGSHNADHFNPAMSVDFLQRIGQLISVALSRFGR
ncbi:MAG: DUF484 family protein [Pseudomonadota bacterium]